MFVTKEQIKQMVERFLGWKLPEDFNPDGGISFKATYNECTPYPMKHKPSGTNLFDYTQAEEMVKYMVEGIQSISNEKEFNYFSSTEAMRLVVQMEDLSKNGWNVVNIVGHQNKFFVFMQRDKQVKAERQ